MMQNPLDLTQTDLRGLMEAGQTLANIPGVGGGSSPLGGISEMLDTAERFFNLFDRFNKGAAEFGGTIAKLRGAEGLGIDQPAQGSFFPAGQVIDGGEVLRQPKGVPHGRYVEATAKFDILGDMGQVNVQHQQIR